VPQAGRDAARRGAQPGDGAAGWDARSARNAPFAALTALAAVSIDLVAATALLACMWDLRNNLTGYDSAYLALAETYGCALVTANARPTSAPDPRCEIRFALYRPADANATCALLDPGCVRSGDLRPRGRTHAAGERTAGVYTEPGRAHSRSVRRQVRGVAGRLR